MTISTFLVANSGLVILDPLTTRAAGSANEAFRNLYGKNMQVLRIVGACNLRILRHTSWTKAIAKPWRRIWCPKFNANECFQDFNRMSIYTFDVNIGGNLPIISILVIIIIIITIIIL
jgi:hypothetical protein